MKIKKTPFLVDLDEPDYVKNARIEFWDLVNEDPLMVKKSKRDSITKDDMQKYLQDFKGWLDTLLKTKE